MKKFLTLAFWSILLGSITYLIALCISIILKADFWHILLSLTVFKSAELSYKVYSREELPEDSLQETEEEDMSKPEPKIDMKKECVDPVSIWKDVSEEVDNQSIIFVNKAGYARLAEYWNDKIYFIENDSGDVRAHCIDKNYYGKKFCTLTDFINSFEQLQKDIEELKKCQK